MHTEGMTTLSTPRAMAQLTDAIRAELIAELVERLEALKAVEDLGEHYRDGVDDAIATIQQAK